MERNARGELGHTRLRGSDQLEILEGDSDDGGRNRNRAQLDSACPNDGLRDHLTGEGEGIFIGRRGAVRSNLREGDRSARPRFQEGQWDDSDDRVQER